VAGSLQKSNIHYKNANGQVDIRKENTNPSKLNNSGLVEATVQYMR
jgi:hypothetical protein